MIRALLVATSLAVLSAASPVLAASMMASGYQMASTDALGSKLIGSPIYSTQALSNGAAANTATTTTGTTTNGATAAGANGTPATSATDTNAQEIGTIRDLILGQDGKVTAVVIGIGGVLGLGEKNVAVSYDDVKWATAQDGSVRGMLDTTADALKSAPDFAYPANGAATPVANTNGAADTSTMAPAAPATTTDATMAAANTANQPANTTTGAAPVTDPQTFANKAAPANTFEIQSSQLALTQSQNTEVKSFAQKMIDDHNKAAQDMQPAAKAENVSVPTALDTTGAQNMAKLQPLNGTNFDQAYIAMQVTAHDDAVALFQGYAQNGKAGPMKDFATKTLPTLQMHQQMIHKMAGK